MTKLVIIYRTCDSVDALHTIGLEREHAENRFSSRFYDIPKWRLIRKCLSSVVDVMDNASNAEEDYRVLTEFICVYDNCSEETLDFIKNAIPEARMVKCDGSGNGDSFATCVNIANGIVDDDTMVLFLEDDYTFLSSNGLVNAVNALKTASSRKGRHCAMFLDDYPDRYGESWERVGTDVMVTPHGHVMRIDSSTCSFMTYVDVVKGHYDELIKFREYPKTMEKDSIDMVWKDVPLYCPLPAITLHCQWMYHIPQYIDARKLKKAMES